MHAGQLPAWHSSTRLAQFKYVEDAAEGSAMRMIEFAPHLSFDKLVQSILKLDSGLGASGAWTGTGREDSVEAEAPAQDAPGLQGQEALPAMLYERYAYFGESGRFICTVTCSSVRGAAAQSHLWGRHEECVRSLDKLSVSLHTL